MKSPTVFRQLQTIDDREFATDDFAPAGGKSPRIGLPELDARAVTAFVAEGGPVAVEHARGLADSLASADANGVRLRTVSRAVGLTRTQLDAVDAALGAAMGRRDFEAMTHLRKLSESLNRRLCALLDQHRRELGRDQARAVLLVGAANNINVGAP